MKKAVICAVFSKDRSEVLLVKRRDIPVWVLPGGGIDAEETPENACIREVLEESGLQISIERKVGEYTPINKLTSFTHLYEAKVIGGFISSSSETTAAAFFPVNALPKMMPPPHPEWIQDAQTKEFIQRKLDAITYALFFRMLCKHPMLIGKFIAMRIRLFLEEKSS